MPANSSSPSASTSTRSAWRSASATSCVVKTTAVPAPASAADELPQARALARVERGRRLVEQQHGRVAEQADRDVHALAVAAREALDRIARAVGEPGLREHPPHRAVRVGAPSSRANRRRFSAR